MALNSETQLISIVETGKHKLLKPARHHSRIVLSKLTRANGTLENCNGYGFFIPLQGEKVYTTAAEQFHVAPGQYVVLNHDQNCHLQVDSERTSVGLNLRLHKSFVEQAHYAAITPDAQQLENPETPAGLSTAFHQGVFSLGECGVGAYLNTILHHLDVESEELSLDESEIFTGLAGQLVLTQETIRRQMLQLPVVKAATRKELYNRLHKARLIITENLHTSIPVSLLARQVALSEAHFLRSFARTFGITPHQYLLQQKMVRIADALKRTNKPVMDIAFEMGFENLSSFSRAFKKEFGVTPSAYRKLAA